MPNWETQGNHRLYRDEDLLFLELHGMFELADVQRMYVITELNVQEYGYNLTIFDARNATGITADSRRYVGEKSRHGVYDGATSIVGASFTIRALVTLIRNAARLFGQPQPAMQFHASPADGLQWLVSQRPQLRAKFGRPGQPAG